MNILKNKYLFLLAFVLLFNPQVMSQKTYKWTDELELLKRIDKLPEVSHWFLRRAIFKL